METITTGIKNEDASPERAYYENEQLWAQDFELNPEERARIDAAAAAVPTDVRSILDVGCGNGAFVHRLAGKYQRVCGADRSEAALKFVRTEKRIASADSLPFGNREFDFVSCMEVIEHLPQGVFGQALDELLRVAGRWLLITVPVREDRRQGLVRCPQCLCQFNRSYHLRSFDDAAMHRLFEDRPRDRARLLRLTTVGTIPYWPGLNAMKRLAAPLRKPDLPRGVVCPQCGNRRAASGQAGAETGEAAEGGVSGLRRIWPSVRVPRWYVGVYERS